MDQLDSDSDSDVGFRINKEYAEKYDKWRQKEELQKLKDKYGDDSEEGDSSSESEDEDAEGLTDKLEKEWLSTLAALKSKDPRIYDKNTKFYDETSESEGSEKNTKLQGKKSSKKEKPYLLKDYERDLILEKGGKVSDSDNDEEVEENIPKGYHEEQDEIKKSLKSAIGNVDSDSEEEFLTKRKVPQEEKEKENADYHEWLKEQKTEKEELVGIDPWNKPDLNENEKFLRDYILNRKYMNDSDDERIPTYDEIVNVSQEEEELEKQEAFERKYNFRYEEPDQEFIKSYPRTIGETVRRKDDRRARKRKEAKDRKSKEKEKKKEELKQLKNLKKREILDKIDLIKEVTGNTEIGFAPEDIDEDFDPEKYDSMMKKAFNDDYYDGEEDDEKPVFQDDEELGLETDNWDEWTPSGQDQCEDNYYDETNDESYQSDWNTGQESGTKKRRRKSKFAKAIAKKKPVFDPNDKTFEEYLDEYYKLDYEDMVGDQPCRFKYRSVVPNDFGLTTDDVLKAKEKELNQWVSVKKMSQYRTKEEELLDVKIFHKKAKRKANVLLSLGETEEQPVQAQKDGKEGKPMASGGKRKNNKKRKVESNETDANQPQGGFIKKQKLPTESEQGSYTNHPNKAHGGTVKKRNKKKQKHQQKARAMSDERLKAYGINPKKFKYTKAKYVNA